MTAATAKKVFRCAIYTRKSTEHNLDLEFNSLDAQREACEAYIKSQAHEGWRLIPHHYDDGAFSGATLERPALQRLLAEVQAGKIDIVVVYKVDRLTRSLSDFAKLVELFDQHAVSFVSVTQSFNTTSSMGRLTLNVLFSFAQFEREVIGERVRDKIAASKKKGIWVGGPVPLGYRSTNKKLVIVPKEAETVRLIFQRYLDLGSISALVQDLDRERIRTKRQVLANGRIRGGGRFGVGALTHLLKNRFYIGEIAYRGETHRGEHEPIVSRQVFESVQAKLGSKAVERELRLKGSSAILMGRIYDDRGNRMTPSHSNKHGVRYRYYVSHAIMQKRKAEAGRVARVSAPDIETAVIGALREHLGKASKDQDTESIPKDDRELIERYVQRVTIKPNMIEICGIRPNTAVGQEIKRPARQTNRRRNSNKSIRINLPWRAPTFVAVRGIQYDPSSRAAIKPEARDALLSAISKARRWIQDLTEGRTTSFKEIAKREGKVERHIRFLAPLAFLSPKIITAIIDGSVPADLKITTLAKALPYSWAKQEQRIGLTISRT
jgi:DNA invertase Pin-like site-specific DNA recombinase